MNMNGGFQHENNETYIGIFIVNGVDYDNYSDVGKCS